MSEAAASLKPIALRKDGSERLVIEWNDGHRSFYTWKNLRDACPCATCRDEHTRPPDPFRILTPAELAPKPPLAPKEFTPVGHYAYKIVWNDGHDTGLYTLENLRALCECPECQQRRAPKD
jgi:DUF971 family protein